MSMADHNHDNMVPRPALMMAGALVAGALALTVGFRLAGVDPAASPALDRAAQGATMTVARDLTFADRDDGAVVVAERSRTVRVLQAGEQDGFIRGVLRVFARERRGRGVGPEAPFRLALWSDGSLSLTDSATRRSIDLGGFGPSNRAAFMALLEPLA